MARPRVLFADDQAEILEAVSRLVDGECEIVASVHDGKSALEGVARLDPDVVVLDISMPVLNGIETASRLRESACRARVVFLTFRDDPDYVEAAFSLGAFGYVLKSRMASDLLPAIREVSEGRKFVSPALPCYR